MNQMRAKSSSSEPITDPRTEPTITPARWALDDSPLMADEDRIEDETDEGDREGVVGEVVGREVVKVEDDDGDEVVVVVEGSTEEEVGVARVEEVGVARVENVMTDPELVGKIVGRLDDDGAGEDEPPKTQTPSVPRGI
jgi:hypothetical protein